MGRDMRVEEAQERILAGSTVLTTEIVALTAALGRVLAVPIVAGFDLPPFANSSMDGYALRALDVIGANNDHPVLLTVIGEVPAGGTYAGAVQSGTAIRIFTGAPLPAGADAVVQQELTAPGSSPNSIAIQVAAKVGTNIRAAGSDIPAGTPMLSRGTGIGVAEVALLAALGLGEILVVRRPRVAIVATGNELVEPGGSLLPGQIYNSNTPMLAAAVREAGGEPWILPVARDDLEDIRARFAQAQAADLILTSGGVSVGDYDLVRQVLNEQGAIDFWRVNVRPGKPLAFGTIGQIPLIGLPGNPVSSAVTFELFARPLIRTMLGYTLPFRPTILVRLSAAQARGDRRHYMRVVLRYEADGVWADATGDQGSHRIRSMIGADALAIIEEGEGTLAAGSVVSALAFQ